MRARLVVTTIAVVAGILGVAGTLGYIKYRSIMASIPSGPPPEFPETVQVVSAVQAPFQRQITAVGTVRSVRSVVLAAEVAGRVVEVGFESGQRVERGRVLLRLDDSTEQADLRAAVASAELARANLSRMESAPPSAVVQMDVDRMRAELLQAEARVEQIRSIIAKKTIVSPFDGVVGLRDIHPGQYVAEGREIAALQESSDQVHIDFAVPQLAASMLAVGSPVGINLGVPGMAEITAQVSAIDPAIDLMTRNARLRATTSSLNGRLAPGMFVDVKVPVGEPVPVVTIAPTAIRYAPFGDYVFVIEPDPADASKLRAHQRFIKLGGVAPTGVIVSEGLKAGERVAADGSFKLREGSLVSVAAAQAARPEPSR